VKPIKTTARDAAPRQPSTDCMVRVPRLTFLALVEIQTARLRKGGKRTALGEIITELLREVRP
jgi:hypothetical protein